MDSKQRIEKIRDVKMERVRRATELGRKRAEKDFPKILAEIESASEMGLSEWNGSVPNPPDGEEGEWYRKAYRLRVKELIGDSTFSIHHFPGPFSRDRIRIKW